MVLLLPLLGPAGAEAQSWRVQAAWVAGHVGGVLVGGEVRSPLGAEPEIPLPGEPRQGPIEVATRDWILTGMLAGGLNVATPDDEDDVQPLAYGHGGILYRTDSSILPRVGGVVLFYLPAGAVGPAALVEAAGVIDLQGGVLYTERGWMGHTALTVSLRFLGDVLGGGGD